MGHAGFYSRSIRARRLIAANARLVRIIRLEQSTGKSGNDKKHCRTIHCIRRGGRNLEPFRQAHLGGGQVMTASLLDRFILRQSAMNHPCEDRQKHDEKADTEPAQMPAWSWRTRNSSRTFRGMCAIHLHLQFNISALTCRVLTIEFRRKKRASISKKRDCMHPNLSTRPLDVRYPKKSPGAHLALMSESLDCNTTLEI